MLERRGLRSHGNGRSLGHGGEPFEGFFFLEEAKDTDLVGRRDAKRSDQKNDGTAHGLERFTQARSYFAFCFLVRVSVPVPT